MRAGTSPDLPREALDALPYAVAIVDPDGAVIDGNIAFTRLCGSAAVGAPWSAAIPGQELTADLAHTETLVETSRGTSAWLSTGALANGGRVMSLRPVHPTGEPVPTREPARLRIDVIGRCQVDGHGISPDRAWLEQRPGQLLRVLIAHRGRVLTADEIADALWPDGGPRSASTVRYLVHTLRSRLEAGRESRAESPYITRHRGGYRLNPDHVTVDADLFEREVRDGLSAHAADGNELARRLLERAIARYRGEFLAEDAYADWAMAERERLRDLQAQALRVLARMARADGALALAGERLAALSDLEPLDVEVHRELIALCLARGRRSEAARRHEAARRRLLAAFGEAPDLGLLPVSGG
ncbi:winged helix-turn-helix domain-containing protein [Svornostia abyssi]|uniref:Winged helix-turn-helix domain-containing protein n=1 Tax=Svornostia abyssi TaxID=2898438 RepID=A0ABY5PFS6_9ACTN|nr:winged helix-turn-helix domain-containing protein [Parviterribacteraceae bacterium J379]